MNTSQIKNFAIRSRNVLKAGVLNRILTLGYNDQGELIVDRPVKIQGGTVFMDQLREESFYDAWIALESRLAKHGIKEVCEEAAYTWFNRLVAIRIMQKNHFIEPVMQYVSKEARIPVIVDLARSGRLTFRMTAQDKTKLDDLLKDSTKTNEQFNLLISAFCQSNPVIFNCFGGIEKHISLLLPDNILSQGGFVDLLNNTPYLTDEDYTESELIGWLYQFYISEKKDEVFAKKGKYTPDEIPAATQIFTPNWIVKYMVENTIGRIYLDNNPYADEIKESMKYLVEPSEPTPKDSILKLEDLTEYKMIDNACGSGHILIESFNLFYRMYQFEGYASRAAIENIFQKNIIGLDIDTRAKQLATFALLMTAAKIDKSFLDCKVMPRVLDFPEPFVYRGGTMEDFLPHYFLGGNQKIIKETIKAFELLKDADSLGSIMKFEISDETREAILRSTEDWEKREFLNPTIAAAIPIMKVILAMTDKYAAVAMNPPYMIGNRFNHVLAQHVERYYIDAKADLFAVFMKVGASLLRSNGKLGMINMQSWMFLSSFYSLRLSFLSNFNFDSLIHLGSHAFEEIGGEVVQCVSFVLTNHAPYTATYCFRLTKNNNKEKRFLSREGLCIVPNLGIFSSIPNSPIVYWLSSITLQSLCSGHYISSSFSPATGLQTGNNARFIRTWSEVSDKSLNHKWFPLINGGPFRRWYGNLSDVIDWENNGYSIRNTKSSVLRNQQYYKRAGITWNRISSSSIAIRFFPEGCFFDQSGDSMFHADIGLLKICMAYLNSKVAKLFFDAVAPTLNLTAGTIGRLPYEVPDNLGSILYIAERCVSISKADWDAQETSREFKVNELVRICNEVNSGEGLFVHSSRLVDIIALYKEYWIGLFNQLHSNEEELNRQFIDIYGLQDELTPDVPMDEITILQQGEISIKNNQIVWHDDVIVKQFISYAIGCWMGRYRLDQEGLYIAHYPTEDEVCTYNYKGQKFEIDDDAIIPLMGTNNPFEDDNALQKLINFIKIVFGEETMTENLNHIEHCLGKSLENYLIKDFWKDHKKMYQNRPIYWLFSSSKGAFQVLTYMHRMNPYTAEKIRTKYLLPYIDYLKGRIEVDEARGVELSTVERQNLAKMKVALDECNEYHDRLHEVAIKAIDFDLDDGVAVNYAKFGDVVAKIK